MKEKYQQIIGAFFIGFLVPGLALRLWGAAPVKPDTQTHSEPSVTVQPSAPYVPHTDHRTTVKVLHKDGTVAEMELDAYLVGVVLAEMPASFEMDALKAQAVVARTYALKRQEETKHPSGAVCTDSHCCQAWVSVQQYLEDLGYQKDVKRVCQAVQETTSEVLTYDGKLIEATYFSCSGGKTEDAQAVWGAEYPYLQTVESPGEEGASCYIKKVYYSGTDFQSALGRKLQGRPSEWLGWDTHTAGGGVDTMEIGGYLYKGTQLRRLLKLNSTAFTMKATRRGIVVTTYGKGHRVGMSQYGADAMAATGKDYREILSHYYPGTTIDKGKNLG